jgi:hypothetical protein
MSLPVIDQEPVHFCDCHEDKRALVCWESADLLGRIITTCLECTKSRCSDLELAGFTRCFINMKALTNA